MNHPYLASILLAVSVGIAPTVTAEIVFSDDFESGDLSHSLNGAQWTNDRNTTVTDAIARSGSHSLQFRYDGVPSGEDGWSEQRFALGRQMTDVWIRWYQYFPAGDEGVGPRWRHREEPSGPENNKLLRLWDDDYSNYNLKAGFTFMPAGNGDSSIVAKKGTNEGGVSDRGLNSAWGILDETIRGRWVEFIVHIKTDDGTQVDGNGILDMKLNGEWVIQNVVSMFPLDGTGNYFQHGYLMGWANSGFDETSYTYIDDVTIADTELTSQTNPPEAPTGVTVD